MNSVPTCEVIEKQILGSVLIEESFFTRLENLTDDFFDHPVHRKIFKFMRETRQLAMEQLVNVFPEFLNCLLEIQTSVVSTANFDAWLVTLIDTHARRVLIVESEKAIKDAYNLRVPLIESLSMLNKKTMDLEADISGVKTKKMDEVVSDYIHAQDAGRLADEIVLYGYYGIDSKIKHKKGEIVTLGGVPGSGKTTLVLNIMLNMVQNGKRTALFCQEMRVNNLISKIVSRLGNLPLWQVEAKKFRDECRKYENAILNLAKKNYIFLRGTGDYRHNVVSIKNELLRQRNEAGKVDFAAIDYIQNLEAPAHMQRVDDVRKIIDWNVKYLQQTAADLNICIIALSQLNRQNQDKLSMTSLKESSFIEQVSSVILLLKQPKTVESDVSGVSKKTIQMECVKNRNGGLFVCNFDFYGALSKFEENQHVYTKEDTFRGGT